MEANVAYEAGVATSASLVGGIYVIKGSVKGKIKAFSSAGVGAGVLGVSATATRMIYYYHGDINNFNLSVFEGTSYDVEVTAG